MFQKHYETKQRLQKVMSRWLPDVKIMPLNKRDEALTVIRKIGCQKQKVLIHREQRPHMLAESVDFTKNAEVNTLTYIFRKCIIVILLLFRML